MSHFSTLQTKITDKAVLIQSLKDLGYTVAENVKARSHKDMSSVTPLAVVAVMDHGYDIGWDLSAGSNGEYGMLLDMWGVAQRQGSAVEVINQINAKYAVNLALKQSRVSGLNNVVVSVKP